jgi:DNA-binding NtrC family response regulator
MLRSASTAVGSAASWSSREIDIGDDARASDHILRDDAVSQGSQTLERHERDFIVATLERHHWQVEGEGGVGINASTLRGRMRKHGIRRPGSRPAAPLS